MRTTGPPDRARVCLVLSGRQAGARSYASALAAASKSTAGSPSGILVLLSDEGAAGRTLSSGVRPLRLDDDGAGMAPLSFLDQFSSGASVCSSSHLSRSPADSRRVPRSGERAGSGSDVAQQNRAARPRYLAAAVASSVAGMTEAVLIRRRLNGRREARIARSALSSRELRLNTRAFEASPLPRTRSRDRVVLFTAPSRSERSVRSPTIVSSRCPSSPDRSRRSTAKEPRLRTCAGWSWRAGGLDRTFGMDDACEA